MIETVAGKSEAFPASRSGSWRISVIGVLAGNEISLSASELLLKSPVVQGLVSVTVVH